MGMVCWQFIVADNDIAEFALQFTHNSFNDVYGAMLAPGAANRNGQVIAVVIRKLGNPFAQKNEYVRVNRFGDFIASQVLP